MLVSVDSSALHAAAVLLFSNRKSAIFSEPSTATHTIIICGFTPCNVDENYILINQCLLHPKFLYFAPDPLSLAWLCRSPWVGNAKLLQYLFTYVYSVKVHCTVCSVLVRDVVMNIHIPENNIIFTYYSIWMSHPHGTSFLVLY